MTGAQTFIAIFGPLFLLSIIPMLILICIQEGERFWPFSLYFGLVIHFANGAAIQFGYGAISIPITALIVTIWTVASFAPLRRRVACAASIIWEVVADRYIAAADWVDERLYRSKQMRAARREVEAQNRGKAIPETPQLSVQPAPPSPQVRSPSKTRPEIDDIFE